MASCEQVPDFMVRDDFINNQLKADLLAELGQERLAAFQGGALRGTVNAGTGFATSVNLPRRLAEEIRALTSGNTSPVCPGDGHVSVPAMMSIGDVENHRDSWGGRRNSEVHSHTVMVWLQGAGSQLILRSDSQCHVVEALPGRLVAFSNRVYSHSVRQGIPGTARVMIGPMAWHSSGSFQPVMAVEWEQPQNCQEWTLCCCVMCGFFCLASAGQCCLLPVLLLRAALGAVRGALAGAVLAPAYSLAYAVTALVWTPRVLCRSCRALRTESCCMALLSLLLLPLRAPVMLAVSLPAIFLVTISWVAMSAAFYPEYSCWHLAVGGQIRQGYFPSENGQNREELLQNMFRDIWRYHRDFDFSPWDASPRPSPVVIGASEDQDHSIDPATSVSSLTWRHLVGEFSMKDVWDACLKRAVALGVELHAAGRISTDDLEGMEPFLFLGLPAVAVVQLVRRSADKSGLVFDEDRMTVTSSNRPHNAFADGIWHSAMRAKRALIESLDHRSLNDVDVEFLELAALNRPSTDLSQLDLDMARKQQLNAVVTAAVELAIFASRSAQFKASMGSVLQEIVARVQPETA
ncbi:unnamed protein product [Symbiodinium sp. CCMP2456]|nr:unnamed protein product [Symbiodinium sp. CCMP2456]